MVAAPLTDLTRKNQPNAVDWSPSCQHAFCDLKTALCSEPVLKSPDFDRPFILQTDVSRRGVGALLSQHDDCSNNRPVAYYSQKLLPCEEKYSAIEKECLAIKLGIQAFSPYLTSFHFAVQTDHRSLEWLQKMKDTNARLMRWTLFLQAYSFSIKYCPGRENGNTDGLSHQWCTN